MHPPHVDIHLIASGELFVTFVARNLNVGVYTAPMTSKMITSREICFTLLTREHAVGMHTALVAIKMLASLEGFRTIVAGISFL